MRPEEEFPLSQGNDDLRDEDSGDGVIEAKVESVGDDQAVGRIEEEYKWEDIEPDQGSSDKKTSIGGDGEGNGDKEDNYANVAGVNDTTKNMGGADAGFAHGLLKD